jgi:hypothetical protein
VEYLGINIGDTVQYYLNISLPALAAKPPAEASANPRMPLLELMAYSAGIDLGGSRPALE